MGRGRKPTAPKLKVLAGTVRPDRQREEGVVFDLVTEFPDPPQHFNTDGMEIWSNLGPQLVAAGVLQIVDLYQLQQLCYAWQRHVAKQKAGMPILAAEDNALKSLWSEFGMSWNSRQRLANRDKPKRPNPFYNNKFRNNGKRDLFE